MDFLTVVRIAAPGASASPAEETPTGVGEPEVRVTLSQQPQLDTRPIGIRTRDVFRPSTIALAVVLLSVVLGRAALGGSTFPSALRLHLGAAAEKASDWFTANGQWLYGPVGDFSTTALDQTLAFLISLSAWTVAVALVAIVLCLGGWRLAVLCAVTLVWVVSVGVWDTTLETLALMINAVAASSIIGFGVGVIASTSRRIDAMVRTILDMMQAFPSFAYLVPVVVLFGAGDTAALICTIVWAVAPIARMTSIGIQEVPKETIEAAQSVGASKLQVLRQVKIPMARPSVLAGLNQTILYAISMATIAALIGAGGLGQPVWSGLTRLEFGQALEPGIALVLIAIILDRTTQAVAARSERNLNHTRGGRDLDTNSAFRNFLWRHRWGLTVTGLVSGFALAAQIVPALLFVDFNNPPTWLQISLRNPVNDLVTWATTNFGSLLDAINNDLQSQLLNRITAALGWLPWPTVLVGAFALGYIALRLRGAILVVVAVGLVGAVGMWEPAIYTVAVVGLASAASIVIGFPLGVLMSRSDAVAAVFRPILDTVQTMPVFLFVIPTVVFLGTGPVAGTLATLCYALPPTIRYTNVGLREADPEVVEAAISVGATGRQTLWQVRVPLGLRTIMVGINQTILLALAMAVVSAFIGTPGLGQEVLGAVAYTDLGLAIEAGFAMFLLAFVADRILTGFADQTGAARRSAL